MTYPVVPEQVGPLQGNSYGRSQRLAENFVRELRFRGYEANDVTSRAYSGVMGRLAEQITDLERAMIARLQETGSIPVSWLHRQTRYQSLLLQAERQFGAYGNLVRDTTDAAVSDATVRAARNAQAMTLAALPSDPGVYANFVTLPNEVVSEIVAQTNEESVLAKTSLRSYGSDARQTIAGTLTDGIAQGMHPNQVVAAMRERLGWLPARAQLLAEDQMFRAAREANRRVFQENSDVVETWIWHAHLGDRTCAACLAMHGTEHPLDEPMGSHPGCRCVSIPKTKSWEELGFPGVAETRTTRNDLEPGDDWFRRRLREPGGRDALRRQLGPTRFGKLESGEWRLGDMVAKTESRDWGTGRRVANLRDTELNAKGRQARERAAAQAAAQLRAQASEWPDDPKAKAWIRKAREQARTVTSEKDVRKLGAAVRSRVVSDADLKTIRDGQRVMDNARVLHLGEPKTFEEAKALTGQYGRKLTKREYDDYAKRRGDDNALYDWRNEMADAHNAASYRLSNFDRSHLEAAIRDVRPGFGRSTETLRLAPNQARVDYFGNPIPADSHGPALDVLNRQSRYFPDTWWDRVSRTPVQTGRVPRGYAGRTAAGDQEIYLSGSPGSRQDSTARHELFHASESFASPRIVQYEQEFYDRRTRGESLQWLGQGYRTNEVTRYDQFTAPYMGKDYGGHAYEVGTMGHERLFSDYPAETIEFLTRDPEHFDFLVGLLTGV